MNLIELVDFLRAPDLQDATIDALIETVAGLRTKSHKSVPITLSESIGRIYAVTRLISPIRIFSPHLFVTAWGQKKALDMLYSKQHDYDFCADFINIAVGEDPRRYHGDVFSGKRCYRTTARYLAEEKSTTNKRK